MTCPWCDEPVRYGAWLWRGEEWHLLCFEEALGEGPEDMEP